MTFEEACKLASIFSSADGGCASCVRGMFIDAMDLWEEIDWLAAAKTLKPNDGAAPSYEIWHSYQTPEEIFEGIRRHAPG